MILDSNSGPPVRCVRILYSIIIPFLCVCGLVQNSICLWVLNRKQFKCSFYVYLRVIAVVDAVLCVFLFLSGFGRGTLWMSDAFSRYNAQVTFPVTVFLVNMGTTATLFITIDRLIYLRNPLRRVKPSFCSRRTARIVTFTAIIVSIHYTLPYCFIFTVDPENGVQTTPFYDSSIFEIYSWIDLVCAALLPATILIIGNGLLIRSIRRTIKLQKKSKMITGKTRRLRDQTKLTMTLIMIVFFYIFFELPIHFTKPKIATLVLYGNSEEVDFRNKRMVIDLITTMLMIIHVNIKFIFYCLFCPPFSRAVLKTICKKRIKKKPKKSKLFCITKYDKILVPYHDNGFSIDSKTEEESVD